MASRRFALGYAAHIAWLIAAIAVFAWLLPRPSLAASKVIVAIVIAASAWWLWLRVTQANRTLARFVTAIGHADLAQGFRHRGQGSGFDELGAAFDGAMQRLRHERLHSASENRFAAALVDEAPTPLLSIDPDGVVVLANKAARRLFRESDGRPIEAFRRYGGGFADALALARPGERRMVRVMWNGMAQRALFSTTAVERQGRPWRIASVQIIQQELDAAELATQTDLVRVLTHEIMNSLTPVTSLAATAERLMAGVDAADTPAIADARTAIEALARRAAGVSHFVESYREFTAAPTIAVDRFAVRPWIDGLARIFLAMPAAEGVALDIAVEPEALRMRADADLLGQVVLNLLKNGAEAAGGAAAPAVAIAIAHDEHDRVRIIVSDNGPGFPAALADDVFLPFFTTRSGGSGIGLSLARQIVQLHGGTIALDRQDGDRWHGVRITL